MKKLIIIGAGAFVLLAVAIGGTLFFTGAFSEPPSGAASAGVEEEIKPKDIYYHHVQPEFVVNFRNRERPRVLMIEMSISSHNEKALSLLDTHTPELRNNLLIMMTERNGTELSTADGKNSLREGIKTALNELLDKHGSSGEVEDIFFTRFVLQ